MAHNTLYEVGQDVDAVIEVRAGRRTCDGEWVDETEQDYCQLFHSLGGWGPPGDEPWRELNLPTANVIIANNLVLQPPGKPSRSAPGAGSRAGPWRALVPACQWTALQPGRRAAHLQGPALQDR